MGGRPLTALSIAAFPETDFPAEWAAAIVRGGFAKLQEAGCVLLGGHSVRDPEIKFGYAVTGLVDEKELLTIAGARVGQVLVLTKPLGTGVIATALKAGQAPAEAVAAATRSMSALNRAASEAARRHGATAATDVTGFGLAGHAAGIARESRVTLQIDAGELPLLPGARELTRRFQPGGLKANRKEFEPLVRYGREPETERQVLLFDPQTSGGLLLALDEGPAADLLAELPEARVIGRVLEPASPRLVVR
jgi:selenide,water dikinase